MARSAVKSEPPPMTTKATPDGAPRQAAVRLSPWFWLGLALVLFTTAASTASGPPLSLPGMPPVVDPSNLYSEAAAGRLSPATFGALPRVYVPNRRSNDVSVIDPATRQVVDRFRVGFSPQHVVPSWDLKTLWVANNGRRRTEGSLTPIDPRTGKPGPEIPVADPYNLYFTPDGRFAIVVAERNRRLDFRDPHTMQLKESLAVPSCAGVNHADFSIDGRYAIFTCEFHNRAPLVAQLRAVAAEAAEFPICGLGSSLIKVDMVDRRVVGQLTLSHGGMPQDIRVSPDGKVFYVADMHADGVFLIDGDSFKEIGFIPTGIGTHGLYPSRDGTKLYVSNRGSHSPRGAPHGPGSISVIDFRTREVVVNWPIPGGGSPDMGNVSADGRQLWLSGRFDDVVYDIDTTTGAMTSIRVDEEPHGLTVWPQPGRYSLGHTGNMR
jgi:YVTN family beta-propeller protein